MLMPLGIILGDNLCKDLDVPSCPTRPVGWQRCAGSTARAGAIIRPVNDPIGSGICQISWATPLKCIRRTTGMLRCQCRCR